MTPQDGVGVPPAGGRVVGDTPARFGLGCVNLGSRGWTGIRLIHHALDLGVRFFDTADAYGCGHSERVLGRALRGRREAAYVATKGGYVFSERTALASAARPVLQGPAKYVRSRRGGAGGLASAYERQDFSPRYLRGAVEGSLRRLGTDVIDLYQLHGPRSVHDDVVALMVDLRSEGKIRGFGVGLEGLGSGEGWLETGELASIQVPFGLLDPQAKDEIIPRAAAQGVPVIARGVLAGGFVARPPGWNTEQLRSGQPERLAQLSALAATVGVSPIQLAMWFVIARRGVSTLLVGTSSMDHLSAAVRYTRMAAPEEVLGLLDRLVAEDSVPVGGAPQVTSQEEI
jgi:aryl-alcohol dehydrogenase-like predicted oxidoreductase